MKLDGPISYAKTELMPGVPLYVYGVSGSEFGVVIDTGVAAMREQLLELCREVGDVRYVLLTHAHADHIGCNRAVRDATGARFAAAGALPWIEDMATHYREFCLVGDDLPDSPEQREEIMGLMDGPVHVDFVIGEGTRIRPDPGTELLTVALPGHKLEEVGFLMPATGDLIMGDLLLALAAPFFHGFQTARGFRSSLSRVEGMLADGTVKRILPAHHPPLLPEEASTAIEETRKFLDGVQEATVEAANGVTFPDLWREVCTGLGKQLEFRGYAMLRCQVDELVAEGVLTEEAGRIARV